MKQLDFEYANGDIEMYQVNTFYYTDIPGICSFTYSVNQDRSCIHVEHRPKNTFLEMVNVMQVEDLMLMLDEIRMIILNGEDYLLYQENYLLSPEHVEVELMQGIIKVKLIYLPLKERKTESQKDWLKFNSLIAKRFNELNDMEGYYYLMRMIEEIKSDNCDLDLTYILKCFVEDRKKQCSKRILVD